MLARTERIKQAIAEKGIANLEYKGVMCCIERARHWTESYRETEGEPPVIRSGKALAKHLEKKTIYIMPDELIVGNVAKDANSLPIWVELNQSDTVKRLMLSPGMLDSKEWKELDGIMEYWKGRTLEETCIRRFPDEVRRHVYPAEDWKAMNSAVYQYPFAAPTPDLEMLFSLGLKGIMKRVEKRLEELDPLRLPSNKDLEATQKQRDVLNAMLIAGGAVIRFAERYSELANGMAKKEGNPVRRAELEQIAENCVRVPAEPPETFWQALQAIWFVHIIDHCFEGPAGGLGQRFDKLLYPFYHKETGAGRLTREKAQELLEDLWVKYERQIQNLRPWNARQGAEGSSMFQNIPIGGVDEFGKDITNELSYLILDATKSARTTQPTLSIRYHSGTPYELIAKSWDVIKSGMGMPAFFNDDTMIAHLLSRGVSLKDARNYSTNGCMGVSIAGKNTHTKPIGGTYLSVAKCLDLALHNGVDILDGKQEGPKTGDPRMLSYEELFEAFRQQLEYAVKIGCLAEQVFRITQGELFQRPFSSLLYKTAMERGEDVTNYEDYGHPWMNATGAIDAADSLTAIKKLIYEDKKITWDKLIKALEADFKGYEDIRRLCLEAPKWGNDDDYVDTITKKVFDTVDSEMEKATDLRGYGHRPIYASASVFVQAGKKVAALPCGRKAREPVADGGASPEVGFGGDPIKVARSVSKLDHVTPVRVLLNQRLATTTTAKQFVNFIRAWGDLGLSHSQFNVVDTATLRDAQVHPEKNPDLIVRVAGYSARFIYLSKISQDAIIARLEQHLPAA